MKKKIESKDWQGMILHEALLYAVLFVGLLPLFWITYYFYEKRCHLTNLAIRLESAHQRSHLSTIKKNTEERILQNMKGADPYYLDKYVESLSFLEAECKKWERLSSLTQLAPAIEKRLNFLHSNKNTLSFAEGAIVQEGLFREVEEKQKHPVEINEEDLKKIICVLEGVDISPYLSPEKHPQFIVKQFDLTKKTHEDSKEKVFILSMQLLKREFVSPSNP